MVRGTGMNPESQEEKNIALAFRFMRDVVDDPSLLDQIPNNATIVFLPEDDPEQVEANLQLAINSARSGKNVYLHHVKSPSVA
jgi:hypothetical protein